MKIVGVLLLALSVVFLVVAADQILILGPANGYWALMLSVSSFLAYVYYKNKYSIKK